MRVFEYTDEKLQHNNADLFNVEASSIYLGTQNLEEFETMQNVCSD